MGASRTLSVAGVVVDVHAAAGVPDEVVGALLGAGLPIDASADVTVEFATGTAVAPGRLPDASVMDLRVWRDEHRVTFAVADVVAVVDETHVTITGPHERLTAGVRVLRLQLLGHLFPSAGVSVVHGALVSHHDADASILAIGTTGSGKSTTALAALERDDWRALADDVTVVRLDGDAVSVAALGIPLHLPSDLGGALLASAPALANDERARRQVAVDSAPWRPLSRLVVIGHGVSDDTTAVRVDGRRAMHPLLEAFPANRQPSLRSGFMAVTAALCRVPVWRIDLGRDPARRLSSTALALDMIIATDE